MSSRIKVIVSPFYRGRGWTDEATQISFDRDERGAKVYSINTDKDLTGIRKQVRQNNLTVVEGDLPQDQEPSAKQESIQKDRQEQAPAEPKTEAPKEEPKAEEAPAKEEATETPSKSSQAKKSTGSKKGTASKAKKDDESTDEGSDASADDQ